MANTGVLHWGGRLLALWESGRPHALDPQTLETLGETDLGGAVTTPALAAHYRVVTQPDGSKRWTAFAFDNAFSGVSATFYEFGEDGRLISKSAFPLPGVNVSLVHDMAVTENYYVLVLSPLAFQGAGGGALLM